MPDARRNPFPAAAAALALLVLAGCGSPQGLSAPAAGDLAALSSGAVVRGTQKVDLFVEPEATVQPLLDAISNAKKSIHVEVYILSDDRLIQALVAAANRGVKVQVMLDPAPYNPSDPDNPLPINQQTRAKLAGTKVRLGWSDPAFRFTHAKVMMVDGTAAFVLTMNFSKSGSTVNREFGAIDTDAADVRDLENLFKADWSHVPYSPTSPRLVVSPNNAQPRLQALIAGAKKSLVIDDEILADPDTVALLGAKAKEGLDVKVLLAAPGDIPENAQAAQNLKAVGVTTKYITSPTVHAKMILADGARGYIGSVNLSTNSLKNNREVGIILTDSALLGVLQQTFASDWARSVEFGAPTRKGRNGDLLPAPPTRTVPSDNDRIPDLL